MNALGQGVILHEVADEEVLEGNQVARRDERACQFPGMVLTLPTHLQIRAGQAIPRLQRVLRGWLLLARAHHVRADGRRVGRWGEGLRQVLVVDGPAVVGVVRLAAPLGVAVLGALARELAVTALEGHLGLPKEARVRVASPIRVGDKSPQPDIEAQRLPRGGMDDSPVCLDDDLRIVAVGTAEEPDPLKLVHREGRDASGLETPDGAPIGKGEVLPLRVQLPAGLLVLDAAPVVLEAWVALLPWHIGTAAGVEATESGPGPVCRRLAGLRVQPGGEGELFG